MSTEQEPQDPPAEIAQELADLEASLAETPAMPDDLPEDFDSSQSRGSREDQAARSADEVAGNSNSALGVPVQETWKCPMCVDFRLNDPDPAIVEAHEALHPA